MDSVTLLTRFMPVALGVIMLGLGLTLHVQDFTRILKYPKAAIVGLTCQMILLPILCFAIAKASGLPPELAVGLMLLAASPGGATANLYSHLAHGDVALNITLTAVNSVLSLFTLPLIVNFSLEYFMDQGQFIPMQFQKVVEVFAVVLIPVTLGMAIKNFFPAIAHRLSRPVKISSALLLAVIILIVTLQELNNLKIYFFQVGIPALIFNVLSMLIGYIVPLLVRLGKPQAIAISMEIGIHNGALAIFVALNVLHNSTMSMPAALYSLIMFFTAAAFGVFINLGSKKKQKI
ncbi:MAG: transporter [Chitinophagales bacterium]|nr:MAG: transporter [Chitinophagales bacterium]